MISSLGMAGRELAIRNTGKFNLREVAARATLREIRLKGHVYVELREVGKRIIFFCNLCLTPCYSDSVLFDHLQGNLHARRYAAAKITLFGPVPWPFNDGVLFFNNSCEQEQLSISNSQKDMTLDFSNGYGRTSLNGDEVTSRFKDNGNGNFNENGSTFSLGRNDKRSCDHDGDNCKNGNGYILGIPANGHGKSSKSNGSGGGYLSSKENGLGFAMNGHDRSLNCNGTDHCLTIHGVLLKDEVSILKVQFMGFGQIACRIPETEGIFSKISRIWCAWLGEENSDDRDVSSTLSKCDFSIINFPYTYDLGRKGALDYLNPLRSPGSSVEIEDVGSPRKRRKESFSDPEETSEGLSDHCGSSGDDCSGLTVCTTKASHQIQTSRLISSKGFRRELRRQKRLAAEKMCDICGQPMLPGKDVATLLNRKTGNLACSSRNTNGAFHVFHTSCLTHWILLCEFEIWNNQSANKKNNRGRKGKVIPKNYISSVFCPECQGTGTNVGADELEKPTIPLSEMFLFKLKAIEAHKAWMKNPEVLEKCSTGLHFHSDSAEKIQEKVMPVKLLHFYRADT